MWDGTQLAGKVRSLPSHSPYQDKVSAKIKISQCLTSNYHLSIYCTLNEHSSWLICRLFKYVWINIYAYMQIYIQLYTDLHIQNIYIFHLCTCNTQPAEIFSYRLKLLCKYISNVVFHFSMIDTIVLQRAKNILLI